MNIRNLKRKTKPSRRLCHLPDHSSVNGRSQAVYETLMVSRCVDCGSNLTEISFGHLRCDQCGWEVECGHGGYEND